MRLFTNKCCGLQDYVDGLMSCPASIIDCIRINLFRKSTEIINYHVCLCLPFVAPIYASCCFYSHGKFYRKYSQNSIRLGIVGTHKVAIIKKWIVVCIYRTIYCFGSCHLECLNTCICELALNGNNTN